MSAPKAPDPVATARAQTKSNIDTAAANSAIQNANEISPTGTVKYNQIGTQMVSGQEVPRYERTVSLSPEQQKLYDQQTALGSSLNNLAIGQVGKIQGVLDQPFEAGSLPAVPQAATYQNYTSGPKLARMGDTSYEQSRKSVEDAIYSRLEPQLQQSRDALEQRLRNQGLVPGTEAYNRAVDETNRTATDARMQAVLAGGQEQSRLAGLDLSRVGFNNSASQQEYQNLIASIQGNNQLAGQRVADSYDARARALQEATALRNQPLNEISALMSGGQVSMPNFAPYRSGTVAGTDIAGLINQKYQADMANYSGMMGGIAGLAGGLATLPMGGGMSLLGGLIKKNTGWV